MPESPASSPSAPLSKISKTAPPTGWEPERDAPTASSPFRVTFSLTTTEVEAIATARAERQLKSDSAALRSLIHDALLLRRLQTLIAEHGTGEPTHRQSSG